MADFNIKIDDKATLLILMAMPINLSLGKPKKSNIQ